ncbi:hypothetical protein GCM10009530_69170 [Microbispora corallina]|uniref:Uncharacterized protein n=1 Tax=Microbispora corallina TaxID=83302 RepID=A0ABQ4FSL2_9ACTN|nr:hypothetical protein Mco01_08160 [Microbispora corallina]
MRSGAAGCAAPDRGRFPQGADRSGGSAPERDGQAGVQVTAGFEPLGPLARNPNVVDAFGASDPL